jgi:transcription antitermination factor NusG
MAEQPIVAKITGKRMVRKLERPPQPELGEGEPGPRWFAVLCRPRMEEDADRNLRRMRYHTFFPHLRTRRKGGRVYVLEIIEPLFPQYLFLGLRKGMGLYYANEAVGVSTVVHLGGDPLEIPAKVMTEIMARCDGDTDRITPPRKGQPVFGGRAGDQVLLGERAGAFQGFTRSILRIEGSQVILDWVTGELSVPLDHVAELIPAQSK